MLNVLVILILLVFLGLAVMGFALDSECTGGVLAGAGMTIVSVILMILLLIRIVS